VNVVETALAGVLLIEPKVFADARGFFMESYNARKWGEWGINCVFVQDNHSLSVEVGVLRGLHYQLRPFAQTKLVRVLHGAIYDVVVDLRKDSSSYGQWAGFTLSSENRRQLYIPSGFAHGFCTLIPQTEVLYKVDHYYSMEHERGIAWNDPTLQIQWPTSDPVMSDKDRNHPILAEAEVD